MHILITIGLKPGVGPDEMATFETRVTGAQLGLDPADHTPDKEAVMAGTAFLALIDDVKAWLGGRMGQDDDGVTPSYSHAEGQP